MTWHPGQLKHWLSLNDSGVWGDEPDGHNDVEVLRSTDITLDGQWSISDPAVRSVPMRDRMRKTLQNGDLVVVTSSGSEAHLGKTAIVNDAVARRSACFANFVQRLRPSQGVDARYVRYFLISTKAKDEMAALGSMTTGLRNLNGGLIGSVTFPGPPLAEQRAIADYLDAETARIDALIAKKQQLIHLLEERWIALRNASILQRVDPVSGRGALPEGWTFPQLGVLVELQRGHDLPAEARREGPFPVVSSGGISGYHDEWACRAPAVVTGRYGTVGEVFYLEDDCWPLNTTLYVKDFRGDDPRWVAFLLESLPLDAESEKSAVGGINRNVIGKLRVPRPQLDEQQRIAAVLARAETRQETTIRALQNQIVLLREHRQAAITVAVTGEFTPVTNPRRSATMRRNVGT